MNLMGNGDIEMRISFNVVKKQEIDVKEGDVLYGVDDNGRSFYVRVAEIDVGSRYPFQIGFDDFEWVKRSLLMNNGIINPDGTVNVLERVSDSHVADNATTEPSPETRIIPIDGVKHVITRKPCGKWGEPVLWEPQVGDEVELGQLKKGDRVLIEGVYYDHNEVNGIGIRFPHMGDKVKLFKAHDKVIYNGKSES